RARVSPRAGISGRDPTPAPRYRYSARATSGEHEPTMSHLDPHVLSSRVTPAAEAAVAERARFLQRTYTWLLYGILAFCATLWAYDNVPAVENLSNSLF